MSISKIKNYVNLCMEGNNTVELCRQIILDQKLVTEQKIKEMNKHLDTINKKLKYYTEYENSCNPKDSTKNECACEVGM